MREYKRIELKKLDDDGAGLAQIATLSAVDHDGDTYAKGAFGDQQVLILAGHSWAGVPIGKGRVFEKGDNAFAEFKLNLSTTAGSEWHKAIKFDMAHGDPLTEWSYGFKIIQSTDEVRDGKSVRVLEKLDIFEVSPVIKGAGIDTHTVEMKGRKEFITDADALIEFAERLAAERKSEGKPLRAAWLLQVKDLRDRFDALLADADPTVEPTDQAEAEDQFARLMQFTTHHSRR